MSENNCVQIIHGDYWLMDSGFTVTAKEGQAISSYVWNWLLQNKDKVYNCGRATAQVNIDMETFKSLEIPVPSIERQRQIVEAIDGWTPKRRSRRSRL
jgi:restriction endonuclease S subunit